MSEPTIIAVSASMREALAKADRVAASDTKVLITGESGTGKELIARRIHARSRRSSGPFESINCGALVETLLESELFGYEKEAFTGAVRRTDGLFHRADGGTLFLDEVGEMSLAMQVKLLRVLQEGVVRRVGGGSDEPVDVRIVAATHRDLLAEVGRTAFRQDLYYRINVYGIELSPLRDRREDIVPLVEHWLEKRPDAQRAGISAEALERLEEYDWPGNVRELENVLEQGQVNAQGAALRVDDLPEAIRSARPRTRSPSLAFDTLGGDLDVIVDALVESFAHERPPSASSPSPDHFREAVRSVAAVMACQIEQMRGDGKDRREACLALFGHGSKGGPLRLPEAWAVTEVVAIAMAAVMRWEADTWEPDLPVDRSLYPTTLSGKGSDALPPYQRIIRSLIEMR